MDIKHGESGLLYLYQTTLCKEHILQIESKSCCILNMYYKGRTWSVENNLQVIDSDNMSAMRPSIIRTKSIKKSLCNALDHPKIFVLYDLKKWANWQISHVIIVIIQCDWHPLQLPHTPALPHTLSGCENDHPVVCTHVPANYSLAQYTW